MSTVSTPSPCPGDGVEGDAGRVAALGPATVWRADPVAPGLQLVGGGGAEGVRRAEHHGAAVGDQHPGELAAGGRLAGAVDPDDEHDGRDAALVRHRLEAAVDVPADRGEQLLAQQRPQLADGADAVDADLLAQPADQLAGGGDAHVGGDQRVLDLLPGVLVEVVARQQREQPPPRVVWERDSRERSRCSRPAVGSGTSRTGPTTAVSSRSTCASSGRSTTSTLRRGVSRGTSASSPVPGR
jgi:hypothetical protein